MWGEGAQKMGMSEDERGEEGGSGTITRSTEEDKAALWGKGTVSMRSSNEYERMNNNDRDK